MEYGLLRKAVSNVLLIICLSAVLLVTGCAADAKRMVPTDLEVVNRHSSTISVVNSIGGHETNPLWTSQISDVAYTAALKEALGASGVFSAVLESIDADNRLEVTIEYYDKPLFGIDFKIKMTTLWRLFSNKTNLPVWTDTIKTSYTAKLGDALVAAERLQKANEGVVRGNIKEGIKRLSMLEL